MPGHQRISGLDKIDMKVKILILMSLIIMPLALGCGPKVGEADPEIVELIKAQEQSWNDRDFEAFMAYFSDQIVVSTPIGDREGKAEIRDFIRDEMSKGQYTIELHNFKSKGDSTIFVGNQLEGKKVARSWSVRVIYEGDKIAFLWIR